MSPSATISRASRLEGGLLGLLIGDAMGVPYESKLDLEIPPRDTLEMEPPADYPRSHASVPPGTWSDDGAQALCLLQSLIETEVLDLDDLTQRIFDWRHRGYMAVDEFVFDCGTQTSIALARFAAGHPPERSGPRTEYDNGNGSLMRVLPLALWHRGSDYDLAADAARQSLPTHGHLRALLCCELLCFFARRMLEGHPTPWEDAVSTVRTIHSQHPEALAELAGPIRVDDPPLPRGSGYVVECLHAARFALRESTYEGVIRSAIAMGHDTDTTAAVAGGLAGVRDGIEGIPARWRSALRGMELVEPLLGRLRARR